MNILIDCSELSLARLKSSIPLYILRFISAIKEEEKKNFILLIKQDIIPFIKTYYSDFRVLVYEGKGYSSIFRNNILYLYSRYKLNKIINENGIDCFFVPTDYPIYSLFKLKCRKVVVIHDLKGLKEPCKSIRKALQSLAIYKIYKRSLETSDDIIAISKYTKQDIQIYFPDIPEKKIHVIYNSVLMSVASSKPHLNFPEKYILYVNTLHPYKNVKTLINAFSKIKNKISENILLVGKATSYWDNEVLPLINKENIRDRVFRVENITDEELRWLYEHASLFVTTSLREGFGYTPIEAAECLCPVICTMQEALPDTTQGLLNYYQPALDSDALANKIVEIISDKPTESKLQEIADYYKEKYSSTRQYKLILNLLTNSKQSI